MEQPYYEYMLVDGITYYPVNTEGNSAFEIPVLLDEDMVVSAQTVAMSEPHEIDYTLRFDSATMKPLSDNRAVPISLRTAVLVQPLLSWLRLVVDCRFEAKIKETQNGRGK